MSNQIKIDFLRNRLTSLVGPAMGWSIGHAYKTQANAQTGEVRTVPNHSAVWIEQAPNPKYWRVCQMCEDGTGERNLTDNYTKPELLAWMDGILKAAEIFERRYPKIQTLDKILKEGE